MPNPRSFSEIFEKIHSHGQAQNQVQIQSMSAGWETFLDPAGLSQLIAELAPVNSSRTHIYRYPKATRPSHTLPPEQQQAYEMLNAYLTTPLHPGFYKGELKSAYRQAVLKAHPDQGGTTESFQQVRKSYEILVRFVTKEA